MGTEKINLMHKIVKRGELNGKYIGKRKRESDFTGH